MNLIHNHHKLKHIVGCVMIQRVQVAGRSHVGTVCGELDGESGLGSNDVLERGDDVALNVLRNGVDAGDVRWNGDENAEPRKVIGRRICLCLVVVGGDSKRSFCVNHFALQVEVIVCAILVVSSDVNGVHAADVAVALHAPNWNFVSRRSVVSPGGHGSGRFGLFGFAAGRATNICPFRGRRDDGVRSAHGKKRTKDFGRGSVDGTIGFMRRKSAVERRKK